MLLASDFLAVKLDSLQDVFSSSRAWCRICAPLASKPPCVVFDIDQTLLDGELALEEACSFLRWCKRGGIFVFGVTARTKEEEAKLRSQLDKVGIRMDGIDMMPRMRGELTFKEVADYKLACRSRIAEEHSILFSVGDQWSEFATEEQLRSMWSDLKEHRHAKGLFFLPCNDFDCVKV